MIADTTQKHFDTSFLYNSCYEMTTTFNLRTGSGEEFSDNQQFFLNLTSIKMEQYSRKFHEIYTNGKILPYYNAFSKEQLVIFIVSYIGFKKTHIKSECIIYTCRQTTQIATKSERTTQVKHKFFRF